MKQTKRQTDFIKFRVSAEAKKEYQVQAKKGYNFIYFIKTIFR